MRARRHHQLDGVGALRGEVRQVVAAIGALHLFAASDDTLAWTAGRMKALGVQHLLGAHCTGIEAVYRLRQLAGLTRSTAVVAAVGATYTHGTCIDATVLAPLSADQTQTACFAAQGTTLSHE